MGKWRSLAVYEAASTPYAGSSPAASTMVTQADALELMSGIEDNAVELFLTDIPYDAVSRSSGGLRDLDKRHADVLTFDLDTFLHEAHRITRGSGVVFCGKEQFSTVFSFFASRSIPTRMIVWQKTNPSPMNGQYLFLSGVECAVYWRNRGGAYNGHCRNTVFRYPNGSSKRHPTEKPLKLFTEIVELCSNAGDVVCDPCVGSGTTAVAARTLGRRFIGGDVDEGSVRLTTDRLRSLAPRLL